MQLDLAMLHAGPQRRSTNSLPAPHDNLHHKNVLCWPERWPSSRHRRNLLLDAVVSLDLRLRGRAAGGSIRLLAKHHQFRDWILQGRADLAMRDYNYHGHDPEPEHAVDFCLPHLRVRERAGAPLPKIASGAAEYLREICSVPASLIERPDTP